MSTPSKILSAIGRGGLSLVISVALVPAAAIGALADDETTESTTVSAPECFWEAPSSATSVTLSSTLTTYGVRAGSAGGDFLGISNTNYDINKGTNSAGNTAYDTISDLQPVTDDSGTSDTSAAITYLSTYWGAGLGIWGTSLNENPNAFYANLYYQIVTGSYSTAKAASLSAATTWMANPETSSWGDSDGSTSYKSDGTTETISGLEYEPDIIWGANKTTAWNLKSNGSNSSTNIYEAEKADDSYNPTYVTNDATNLWTQVYTMGQLATAADELTASSDKTTRYDSSSATESALAYEKITRGQLLYIASLVDAGTIQKKTVAYLYAIDSNGVGYFFTPTASELLTGDDTGGEDISPTLGKDNSSASGADDNYASNNSTINMGYMATLPFVTNTFDSGTKLTNGITMKVEDIYKENPVCTVSSSSSSSVMENVDVIIFNSSTASSLLGTSGGKNSSGITNAEALTVSSVTSFCKTYGLSDDATVIAGDDFGTSTNQGTSDSTYTTEDGTAPMLYCARNYTADKDVRAAWGFAAVFPELYGNNNDATYGYWVDKIYHVQTDSVASVVQYMTNQSDTVTYDSDVADMIEEYAEAGYSWWASTGATDSDWSGYAYYNGSSRASWYGGGTAAEEPTDTIGIFAPSSIWVADHETAAVTVSVTDSKLTITSGTSGTDGATSAYLSAITSVTTSDGTELTVSSDVIDVSSLSDGTYIITISADGYTDVVVSVTVSSGAATAASVTSGTVDSAVDISDATIKLSATSYVYSEGVAYTPTVTVTLDSTTLTRGTDYVVSFANNSAVGTATVTVTGVGNYTGTATATFTIAYSSTSSTSATTAFWTAPSSAVSVTLSSTLTTYGVRAGSAGGDFLGISNTNYDINKGTNSTGSTAYDTISNLSSSSTATSYLSTYWGAGLGIWGTSLNENPNAFYANLYYQIVTGSYSTAKAASLSAATTWMANPETSSWGDSDGSTSYKSDGTTETISGLEYEPDIIWGANKTTAWNLSSDGSNSNTNIYTAESTDGSYNPTYVTNDATNLWTQVYTMGQLATTADSLTASSDKTTRYDSSSATESALAYEKITRGQLLYIASLVDAGTIEKKTVAYLYAIDSDGVGYFFTPTASGLTSSNDTGEGAEDSSGSVSNSATSAKDEYGANNSTINMGYMATLPFVTETFDSGDELSGGIVMRVEDIYSANPTCTVSSSSSSDVMADVDVIIYNSTTATSLSGTSGGKNSSGVTNAETLNPTNVASFAAQYGFDAENGTVIAGDDFGTSTNQGTSDSTYTTEDGTAPMLYCARNYTADKDVRAAWGFAAVFPELYGDNNDATYGYWVDKIYHVNTTSVASVVQYMTNQSDTVTYTSDTATMIENYAKIGYSWWNSIGSSDSDWKNYAYYNGSSRASYYGGGTDAEEPTDTIGIFAPSSLWVADEASATTADVTLSVSSGTVSVSGTDASSYISAIIAVTATMTSSDGTTTTKSLTWDSSTGAINTSTLTEGTWTVTIVASGYQTVSSSLTVDSSNTVTDATVTSGTKATTTTDTGANANATSLTNPVKVKVKTVSVKGKYKKNKLKKAMKVAASKCFKITGNKGGKVSYSPSKITIKKGTKKGKTVSAKVTVKIAKKGSYKAYSKKFTVKIKLK